MINPKLKKPVLAASCLLILLPVVIAFVYVNRFGVSVVHEDQWEMVSMFKNLSKDKLALSELWGPHNEHRLFFSRLAMLALGSLTQWNNVAEMYLILVCFLVTLGCLFLAFGGLRGYRLPLFVPVAFMVFSLGQHRNMLWGYQLTFAFAQMFGVLALCLLYFSSRGRLARLTFPASLVGATIASGSAIQGLLVWPVGLVQILISPTKRPAKQLMAGAWTLAGAAVWTVYFIGHGGGSNTFGSLLASLAHPVAEVRHFLALVGGSLLFSQRQGLVLITGALLLLLAAWSLFLVYRRNRPADYSLWIGLLLLSLLILASITVGRAGLGIDNATASKYVTFSLLLPVSVYAMLAMLAVEDGVRSALAPLGILLLVVVLSIPDSYNQGFAAGSSTREAREEAAAILLDYETQPEERLKELRTSNPQTVPRLALHLERLRYNVFSQNAGTNTVVREEASENPKLR